MDYRDVICGWIPCLKTRFSRSGNANLTFDYDAIDRLEFGNIHRLTPTLYFNSPDEAYPPLNGFSQDNGFDGDMGPTSFEDGSSAVQSGSESAYEWLVDHSALGQPLPDGNGRFVDSDGREISDAHFGSVALDGIDRGSVFRKPTWGETLASLFRKVRLMPLGSSRNEYYDYEHEYGSTRDFGQRFDHYVDSQPRHEVNVHAYGECHSPSGSVESARPHTYPNCQSPTDEQADVNNHNKKKRGPTQLRNEIAVSNGGSTESTSTATDATRNNEVANASDEGLNPRSRRNSTQRILEMSHEESVSLLDSEAIDKLVSSTISGKST